MKNSVYITLYMSEEEKQWIKIYAIKHGIPVSEIFRQYIRILKEQESAAGSNTQEDQ